MIGLLLVTAALLAAQETTQVTTPPDVVDFLRALGTDLANAYPDPLNHPDRSAREFLDHFDPKMPGYEKLRDEVEELTTRAEVGSVIEVASESGDERRRVMELDWVLEIQDRSPRRQLVKCTIEQKRKRWKIVSFDPINFFKY